MESALAFRKGSVDACGVKTQFEERGRDLLDRYDLSISGVTGEATVPSCCPAPRLQGPSLQHLRSCSSPGC